VTEQEVRSVSSTFLPLGETQSRSDLVADSIKTAILSGRLKPGEILVERRIAEELGISKTPVREALIVLARAGLLEMSRNRGTAVRQLTFTEVRYIYEQRALLEPWAVESAIAAQRTQLELGAEALREAEQLVRMGRHGDLAKANRRFHQAMYQPCENTFVTRSLDALQDLTALAVTGVMWPNWPLWDDESQEHWAIYEAAKGGHGDEAAALMLAHIEKSIARLHTQETGCV
jgi:DNA-binding GntR family transcriptional regulator